MPCAYAPLLKAKTSPASTLALTRAELLAAFDGPCFAGDSYYVKATCFAGVARNGLLHSQQSIAVLQDMLHWILVEPTETAASFRPTEWQMAIDR